jgi:hypothetical protein
MAKAIKRTPGEWLDKAIENEAKGNVRNTELYFKKAFLTELEREQGATSEEVAAVAS